MNSTVYRLTIRALLLQRRTLALAALAAAPVVIAFVFALAAKPDTNHLKFYSDMLQHIVIPTVGALIALVLGVSAIGDEREDGTVLYLVATPVSRISLVTAKVVAAWTAAMVLLVPAVVLSGLLVAQSKLTAAMIFWPVLGLALSCLAYCAASAWLSLRVKRPVVIGVIYILLWEGSIANFAPSAHRLSIAAYGKALVAHALPQAAAASVGVATAVIVLAAATALGCYLAARLMSRVELP